MSLIFTKRKERLIHPESTQLACLDEMTWLSGRTLRTFDPGGRRGLYGLCKTGRLGMLGCRGGHQSRRYRRLWPCRGSLRLLETFCHDSWQTSCKYVICLGQKPNCSSRISLRSPTSLGPDLNGFLQMVFQSCAMD